MSLFFLLQRYIGEEYLYLILMDVVRLLGGRCYYDISTPTRPSSITSMARYPRAFHKRTTSSDVDSLPLLVPLNVVTNHIYIHITPSFYIQPPASISAYEDTDPP